MFFIGGLSSTALVKRTHPHTHLYPSPTGEEVAYCVIKSHSASLEKPYVGHHVPNVLINQH